MTDKENKLLMKIATGDKSITVLGDIAKLNKMAVAYAKNPALTVIGDAAETNPAANAIMAAADKAGIQRGYVKPTYFDALKQRAGEAWDWTKGKWNELNPEVRNIAGGVGLGAAGGLAGDALVRLLGGKRNKALRLLGMLGGVGLGVAANNYLQNPDFKNKVNTGFNSLINKFKG